MHTPAKETTRTRPDVRVKARPTGMAVREAIHAAVVEAGAEGIAATSLFTVRPDGLGHNKNLTATERDTALSALIASGLIEVDTLKPARGKLTTMYRAAGAIEREAWFQAEVRRRRLVRAHGIPLKGTCR